ncbi:hypothetical protein PHLGIDRAFT_340250 [Phlebiopsis gigantea 11061_1 CR5-6]|uniref:HMG box domain-containing protein n=1 Tax=Phlebiopsis gigantea (strain 11061_1 CR5-6) TaxID=745531 RepID=A0A0C3SD25_PHLG1|nr:hypothetical protein PHLGIDRAFT_340250 [Phlebiopsis gigantea 11061_1 CR5-6]
MASSLSFVYPEVCGWDLPTDIDSTDQKPALDFSAPLRPSSTSLETPRTSAHKASLHKEPKNSPAKKSKGPRNKKGDVNYVPRPRNCFFIYRCLFARAYSENARKTNQPPTPEKVVSKRAALNWKKLTPVEKEPYIELAREEARKHAETNPNYKYSPRRDTNNKRSVSKSLSRREKVESLVQLHESSTFRHDDTYSEYSPVDSPASHTSSSPEPTGPITPTDYFFHPRGLSHRRSMSLPHLEAARHSSPYEYAHTYFLQPESCASSPGPGPQRTAKRSSSARQRSYSTSGASIPPPDTAFDLEYDGVTIPFATLAPHASSMSLPDLLSLHDLTIDDNWSSTYSTPQMSPAASLHDFGQPEYFSGQDDQPIPSVPLIQRRRRSNTAPSAMLSPLSLVSSTLESYPEASGSAAPTLIVSPPDRSAAITPTRSSTMPVMASLTNESFGFSPYSASAQASSSSLLVPEPEMDIDRTPRRADFPGNVQDVPDIYAQQFTTPAAPMNFMAGPSETFAMDAYTEGLGAFDIPAAGYDMAPFDDVDFSEFFHTSPPELALPPYST